jgi:hypothetical protein
MVERTTLRSSAKVTPRSAVTREPSLALPTVAKEVAVGSSARAGEATRAVVETRRDERMVRMRVPLT